MLKRETLKEKAKVYVVEEGFRQVLCEIDFIPNEGDILYIKAGASFECQVSQVVYNTITDNVIIFVRRVESQYIRMMKQLNL